DRVHRDARARHVDQEHADAAVARVDRAGARQQEAAAGEVGVAGPDLLAADAIAVGRAHGARREAREIGAGAGLGISLAPDGGVVQQRRQITLLLFLAAVGEERRRDDAVADHVDGQGRVGAGVLLEEDRLARQVEGVTAVVPGPAQAGPAGGAGAGLETQAKVAVDGQAGPVVATGEGRKSPGQPLAHAGAEVIIGRAVDDLADVVVERAAKTRHGCHALPEPPSPLPLAMAPASPAARFSANSSVTWVSWCRSKWDESAVRKPWASKARLSERLSRARANGGAAATRSARARVSS